MLVARRVYLYLITFISLLILLSGASTLLRLLFEQGLSVAPDTFAGPDYLREQFSSAAALTLVGVVVWVIHWLLAQRSVAAPAPGGPQERRSVLRKLLIYGVLLVTVGEVLFALSRLLRALLLAGAGPGGDLRAAVSEAVPTALVYGVAWAYYARVRATDALVAPEQGGAATVRRWYVYLVSFVALSELMFALSALARYLWQSATGGGQGAVIGGAGVPEPVASNMAWIIAAGVGWVGHWWMAQRAVALSAGEQRALLRQVYLFAMIFQTVAVTLTSAGLFIYNLLRYLLGSDPVAGSGESLLSAAGGPLLTAIVYGVFWAYHRWVLRGDAALAADDPARRTGLQRLYLHLVALIGLAVLAAGVASLLHVLVDLWLGGATTTLSRAGWADQISFFATSILVGLPVWYLAWAPAQRRAWDPAAPEERQALVRRVYLYLILFAAVIALLVSAGTLIYQFVRHVGGIFDAGAIAAISWALGAALTAAVLLAYHLRVLLADQQAPQAATSQVLVPGPEPEAALLLISNADPAALPAAAAAARGALPATAVVDVVAAPGLTAAELRAWLASRAAAIAPAPDSPAAGAPPGTAPLPATDPKAP
jgi:hypothetical protein